MQLIKPSIQVITPVDAQAMMKRIEAAGRTCWRSESKTCEGSAEKFCKFILSKNHMSVIEHESVSVRVICDRGVLAELSRHRLLSLSVESTRYCNYSSDKRGMQFIIPPWFKSLEEGELDDNYLKKHSVLEGDNGFFEWANGLYYCEHTYNLLLNQGQKPEQARSILPNSLKTELVMTANLREWRHIFDLRTSRSAHPQAREISNMIYDEFIKLGLGVFFEGIAPFRG